MLFNFEDKYDLLTVYLQWPHLKHPGLFRKGEDKGHWSFTICGQIYNFLDSIPNTQDLVLPRLNQMFFLDVEDALMRRNSFANDVVDPALMQIIESSLRNILIFKRIKRWEMN
ncbi:hypothetical protein JTB14_013982 [Gonioctena quinquepunctata]|nr:hypothetical protein JTB14_013982 [Gonioctena quinquepunctata]